MTQELSVLIFIYGLGGGHMHIRRIHPHRRNQARAGCLKRSLGCISIRLSCVIYYAHVHANSYIQCLPQIPIVMAVPNLSSADVNRIIQAISCAITVRPNGNELSTEPSVSGTLAAHHNTNSSSSVSSQETERFERASDGNGGRQLSTRLTRSYSRDGFEFSGESQCSSQDSQSGELSTDVSSRNWRSLRGQG